MVVPHYLVVSASTGILMLITIIFLLFQQSYLVQVTRPCIWENFNKETASPTVLLYLLQCLILLQQLPLILHSRAIYAVDRHAQCARCAT